MEMYAYTQRCSTFAVDPIAVLMGPKAYGPNFDSLWTGCLVRPCSGELPSKKLAGSTCVECPHAAAFLLLLLHMPFDSEVQEYLHRSDSMQNLYLAVRTLARTDELKGAAVERSGNDYEHQQTDVQGVADPEP